MTYIEWIEEHKNKHNAILEKLKGKNKEEIAEYFSYENMKINEPDFCPLYKENKKCHDMEKLNCYFCACPYFDFKDKEKLVSYCTIDSKYGSFFESKNAIHQDCSNCLIPHKKEFVKKLMPTP
jgi:Zn-finger protein